MSQSLRLVFDYDRDTVRLVATQRVEMTAPAPQRLVARPDERGFWVEVRDDREQPLYRRTMRDPVVRDLETIAADGDRLTRISYHQPGRFSIVVPEVAGMKSVLLVNAAPGAEAAENTLRFDLEGN